LIAKSFSRRSSSFFSAIRLFSRIAIPAAIAVSASAVRAVQLDNWRFPYYQAGVLLECSDSSKDRMFWDDMGALPCFGRNLWPDGSRMRGNFWTIEPAALMSLRTADTAFIDARGPVVHYVHDKALAQEAQERGSFWKGQLLSDLRYRNFLVREVLDVDSRNKDDIDYRGKTDRLAAGRIAEAYCQIDWKYGFFRLGRLTRSWGPFPDRSLLLSSIAHSFDGLEFKIASSVFEFRHLFTAFPCDNSSIDAEGNNVNRYLTVHALNLLLGRFGEIGVFESMLFSRSGGWPDFQFINPFSLYTVINTNGEGTGNLMIGLQWDIRPFMKNLSLKGQVLLDDFQVDNKVPMDQEPTHWGADVGAYLSDFLPMKMRHYASLEYRYLSRWLYTVDPVDMQAGLRYTYLGRGLGAETDDNDRLTASFFIAGDDRFAATCGLGFNRQGENSLWSRWKNISSDSLVAPRALGYRTEPAFPSGIVERTLDVFVNLLGYYRNYADFSLRLDNRWIRNKNNVATASYAYDPLLAFTVSLHYGNFFVGLPR
jgi:hypothetical protein